MKSRSKFTRRHVVAGLSLAATGGVHASCAGVMRSASHLESKSVSEVTLVNGGMRLGLFPKNGGSISHLTWRDHEILRRAPSDMANVTDMASFPLVPIVNRIPEGKFSFGGIDVDLEGNFLGLPDFIHGYGWTGEWSIETANQTEAILQFQYGAGGEWPWPFEARQTFRLGKTSLWHGLSVTNLSDQPMPADLGFHPYFPASEATRLYAQYDGYWLNNKYGHAIKRIPGSFRQDFTRGATVVNSQMTDQTHYGWTGKAALIEPGRPTTIITADKACNNMHVFFPPNGDYVAVEPTIGRGNPFGVLPQEYKIVLPEQELSIWMNVEVSGG